MGNAENLIKGRLKEAGAVAVGITAATPVEQEEWDRYAQWIEKGYHAGMSYLENHADIRRNPRKLIEGAKSLICCAFSYRPSNLSPEALGNRRIALYALLPDYHDWVRERIRSARLDELLGEEGKDWRICVDSAPILERYWARKSGIGFIGCNGALIVPGVGAEVVLAEIVTTTALESDPENSESCMCCGACREACPTGANASGPIDCNRCLSYLTIEHKGPWTDKRHTEAMTCEPGSETIFGCDRCIRVCPHNNPEVTSDMHASEAALSLSREVVDRLTPEDFSRAFKGSPIKRAKLAGLRRNAHFLQP